MDSFCRTPMLRIRSTRTRNTSCWPQPELLRNQLLTSRRERRKPILRRVFSTVAVMAMVGIFVFLLLRLAPGDPAAIIAGDTATPQMIAGIRAQLGSSDPLPVQFVRWALSILGGDFGISIFTGRPVLELVTQRLAPTISLAMLTLVLSVTAGVSFGILAAWRAGGLADRVLTAFSALGFSVPVFVVGYFLIYWLAINAHWLPVQGYVPIDQDVGSWIWHLILPTLALSLAYIAFIARIFSERLDCCPR
ncbi:ABC-type dipeptide/oligopeptide/nickel transport system permease component [Bradyrhizobium elkanii]